MNTVLIAKYNEVITWEKEITADVDIVTYSTGDPTCDNYIQPNKGYDANIYLRYILNNYNNLPERILFIHHHKTNWTHDFPLPHYANNLDWEFADFINIGARKLYSDVLSYPNTKKWLESVWHIYEKYLPFPEKLMYYPGTQFMCHRDLILQYPLKYWTYLSTFLLTTTLSDEVIGRAMGEYVWHYLLTRDPIDKFYTNEQILLKQYIAEN